MIAALTGLVAGIIHVWSGPDHLAAIAPVSLKRAERGWVPGMRWGLGHSAGVGVVGLLSLWLRDLIPVNLLSTWGERTVGLLLIGIGLWAFRKALRVHVHEHEHDGERHLHVMRIPTRPTPEAGGAQPSHARGVWNWAIAWAGGKFSFFWGAGGPGISDTSAGSLIPAVFWPGNGDFDGDVFLCDWLVHQALRLREREGVSTANGGLCGGGSWCGLFLAG